MRGRTAARALVAVTALIGLTACGTMKPDSAFTQVGAGQASGPATGASTGQNPSGGTIAPSSGVSGGTGSGGAGASSPGGGATAPGAATGGGGNTQVTTGGGTSGSTSSGATGGPNVASDIGVTPTSVTIGNITGLTGALGPNAFGVTLTGLKVWVSAINAQGGIHGRKIILNACDDAQDSSQNLSCTQTLAPKVFALVGNNSLSSAGSAHSEYQAAVPDLGFPLNNGYNKYPNMFSIYGTDYPRDGKQVGFNGVLMNTPGIYRWFAEKMHITRAAFFFYSQGTSSQAGKAQEQDAATAGIKTVYEGGGSGGENLAAPNFDSDVLAMRGMKNPPEAIFDAMDVNGNQKLCASMDRFGFTVKAKVSTIEVWDQSIGGSGWSQPCRDSIFVATGGQSYADSSQPEVAKYLSAFKTYAGGALQSEWTMQGYAVGQMFGDGLASMGAAPTRKGLINWLANLPPLDTPQTYNNHGLMGPTSYRVDDPKTPRDDCAVIAQWQDTVGTFVTRQPLTPCYKDPLIGSPAVPDGA